ncbi:MAG: hypothetical protein DBY36_02560 [Clostridiales bacterium]|nr:MAG: hypothetical protein DBY36_02560 [Clostridiales bacterium]
MRRRRVDALGQPDGENLAAERGSGKSARPTAEKTDRTGAVGRSNLPDRNVQRALPIRRMSGG